MDKSFIAWTAIGIYVAVTAYLAYRGWKKTSSLESFAVGSGDIPPWVVGLSLSAQLTSVATFVVNPGLIFAYGFSGLLGFGVAAAAGIIVGLVVFSRAFRKIGAQVTALSVPQWVGSRYDSRAFSLVFAVLSLALISFAVLIVVALGHSLFMLTGVRSWVMGLAVILFVFSYVLLGGVNTHAYTNAIQAGIMLVVAFLLIGTAVPALFSDGGILTKVAAIDPNLARTANPASLYFRNLFEVFICNFIVGLALVCQPHILSKALYLKEDKDVRRYLLVSVLAGTVFLMVMVVGLVARVQLPATTKPDLVVPAYIAARFSTGAQVLITIGIVCAGISTLEGILLSLSTITSVDLFLNPFGDTLMAEKSKEQRAKIALYVGRGSIIAFGVLTFVLAYRQIQDPTGGSVAIFGQYGVYALITASSVPLTAGMFIPSADRLTVAAGTAASIAAYVLVAGLEVTYMSNNPAFLATTGVISGWVVFGAFYFGKMLLPQTAKEEVDVPPA